MTKPYIEITVNILSSIAGDRIPPEYNFLWLQANLLSNFIFKISEDKYRYFKCNFYEKTNYAHTFEEKSVLL